MNSLLLSLCLPSVGSLWLAVCLAWLLCVSALSVPVCGLAVVPWSVLESELVPEPFPNKGLCSGFIEQFRKCGVEEEN